MDPLLRAAILGNSRAALLEAASQQQQFTLLREEAMRLVWEGITTLAEMVRVTSDAEED
jgi:MSHA biogenesis protein MshE